MGISLNVSFERRSATEKYSFGNYCLFIPISELTLECLTVGSSVYFYVLKINKFEIGIFFHEKERENFMNYSFALVTIIYLPPVN